MSWSRENRYYVFWKCNAYKRWIKHSADSEKMVLNYFFYIIFLPICSEHCYFDGNCQVIADLDLLTGRHNVYTELEYATFSEMKKRWVYSTVRVSDESDNETDFCPCLQTATKWNNDVYTYKLEGKIFYFYSRWYTFIW